MVGTITLTGLGSGMDIEGLVTGLVGASSQQLDAANRKVATQRAAVTTLTGISSLLSDLKGAIDSLDTASEVASFSATTSSNAIQATSSGLASPARYEISIQNLAQEQRTYSAAQTSSNDPLGLAGTMTISQGGTDFELTIDSSDSLDQIGSKLNAVGADVSASIFSDGSGYRLQLRSNDTGDDQAFTVTQSGFDLGLQDPLATVQEAKDASVVIDGFTVTSSNNTIDSAIQGVTLELKEPSSDPIQLSVAADPVAMQNSLEDFVSKYNAVIGRIHSVAGFGGSKGTSEVLSGDSTLRTITNSLSNQILSRAGTGGALDSLADLGVRLNNDGTLKVEATELKEALTNHPDSFRMVLAGDNQQDGLMDVLGSLVKGYTDVGTGLLAGRKDALDSSIKLFQAQATRESTRLDRMEERLRASLAVMDAQVAQSNTAMSYFLGG